jgi:hypothetical protein
MSRSEPERERTVAVAGRPLFRRLVPTIPCSGQDQRSNAVEMFLLDRVGVGRFDAPADRQFDHGTIRVGDIDHLGDVDSRGLRVDAGILLKMVQDAIAGGLGGFAGGHRFAQDRLSTGVQI